MAGRVARREDGGMRLKKSMRDELSALLIPRKGTSGLLMPITPFQANSYVDILGIGKKTTRNDKDARETITRNLNLPICIPDANLTYKPYNTTEPDYMQMMYKIFQSDEDVHEKLLNKLVPPSDAPCSGNSCAIMGGRRTRKSKKSKRTRKAKKSTRGTRRV